MTAAFCCEPNSCRQGRGCPHRTGKLSASELDAHNADYGRTALRTTAAASLGFRTTEEMLDHADRHHSPQRFVDHRVSCMPVPKGEGQ